jgi:hypothetical protein
MPSRRVISVMATRKCKRADSDGSSDEEEFEHVNKKQQILDLEDGEQKPDEREFVPETPMNSQGEYVPMTQAPFDGDGEKVSYSPDHSPPPEDKPFSSGGPATFEEWLAAVKSTGRYAITLGKEEYYEQAKHAIQSMLGSSMDVEEYMIHVAETGLSNGKAPAPPGCLFPCEYKMKHGTLFKAFLEGEEEGAETRLLKFLLDTRVFQKSRFERSRCLNVATMLRDMPMYETLRIAIYLMAVIAKEDVDALF